MAGEMVKYASDFMETMKKIGEIDPNYLQAFMHLLKEAEKPGVLSTKVKELISVALSVSARCTYCIAAHVKNAIDAGATRQEIIESALVSGLMGGGPSVAYIKYVFDALDEFGAK